MKKYLILILTLFSIGLTEVTAAISDECVDNGTCMVLCNYQNTIMGGRYNNQRWYRNITIYYDFEEGLMIKYESPSGEDPVIHKKGPYPSFSYTLSKEGGFNAFWGLDNTPSVQEFSCPANGYLDTSGLNGGNEVCFDDDGKTCQEIYNGLGTNFGSASQEKTFDFEDDIEAYIDGMFDHIKEDVSSGAYSNLSSEEITQAMYEKMVTDFQTNYLHGNKIPAFIANSDAYQSIYDNVEIEFNKTKEEVLEEAEQDLAEGNITQDEYDNIVNNWSEIDTETVVEGTTEALEFIKRDSVQNSLDWEANTCGSILGDVHDSDDPAYYLNFAFNIIKYAAIVILLVFTVLDFAKAIVSSDNDALKKALKKAIKRIIICVVIFFLPILIEFVLELLGVVEDPICGIGVS